MSDPSKTIMFVMLGLILGTSFGIRLTLGDISKMMKTQCFKEVSYETAKAGR